LRGHFVLRAIGKRFRKDRTAGCEKVVGIRFALDSSLEEARFEPSVPLWLGAFTRSKTSMSGPVGVGGFEEGEFEGDGPLEKVAAVG
jgi:hypothetical protein